MREACCQLGVALVFPQFGEDFCAAPLGALFLGDGMAGAGLAGREAVVARVSALAGTLDLAATAAVFESGQFGVFSLKGEI